MSGESVAVGVDLGGTNVRAAVVDREGRILSVERARVADDRSLQAVLEKSAQVIEVTLRSAKYDVDQVSGIGVGVAGQVRGVTGVIANAPNLDWREEPFGERLTERLGREVRVVNDLDAIAWGEVAFGSARGHLHVLVVFAGTGVGGGWIIDGRLHHGASGVAGEIGHVKVCGPDGRECGCGARGCLEAYLGGDNLNSRLNSEAGSTWSGLRALAKDTGDGIHPGLVEELLQVDGEDSDRAMGLWRELSEMFGTVLANAISLLNPSALVLGGTVMDGCATLREMTEAVVWQRVSKTAGQDLTILQSSLGDDAGIIGAAALGMGAAQEGHIL